MDIINSVISKIGDLLVKATGRQLGYLFYYKDNIKDLAEETEKLKNKRDGIQMSIDAATRNSEVIAPEVQRWVTEVDKIMTELGRFLEDVKANKMCFKGWCPNLMLQHSWGRKAKKSAEAVLKLQQEGKFDRISYPAPPTGMHISSSMKDFNSRTKILKQVMEALRNGKMSVIAICGMGGIGKKTMAKEVARRVKEEKLFGEVVMSTVSQNPNVHQIQGRIADILDIKLVSESEEGRAGELLRRMKEARNFFVILDDMWDGMDLEAVGIPNGCKILLTSRDENVCKKMKSQKTFTMEVLSENEAMNLFEEVAGISIHTCTRDLYNIAEKVANECKGLPVAIVTVGGALKNRDEKEWKDALHQLQNSKPDSILEMDKQVYSSIELSYNFLRSEEAKSCFLLCCLFPEDHNIGIETLVRYGKGLRLFQETGTMGHTRNRVHALVQNLKRCFLLMDSDKKECVRMHDIVRDVAISIAKRKEHGGVIVRCENEMKEWPEIDSSEIEDCTAISLVYKEIKKHPDSLACPKLKLLSVSSTKEYCSQELSDNFFRGIKELKVLDLQRIDIQSLPASLQILQNLRTLHLEYCVLQDISTIGGLVMLEILSLFGSEIKEKELPKDIGNLQHLKVLDMTECSRLERIPPGVISSLTSLEELKIYCFRRWNSLDGNKEKTCTSLAEIIPLFDRYLKVLNVDIPKVELVPQNFPFKNLTRFVINIGSQRQLNSQYQYLFENCLRFEDVSTDAMKESGIQPLVKKCGVLDLYEVCNLKNLFPHFDDEEDDGFKWLTNLVVIQCKDMEYLVKFSSNNNQTDLQVPIIFPLLEELYLEMLDGLKGVFHARLIMHSQHQFLNLRNLCIGGCPNMNYVISSPSLATSSLEEIVSKQKGETDDPINTSTSEDDMIVFPKLTKLTLYSLRSLISLCRAIDDDGTRPHKDADEGSTNTLNPPAKVLVPFKCIKWFPSLEILEVKNCPSIRVLFSFHGDDSTQLASINSTNINIVDQPNDSEDLSHKKCCLIGCLPRTSIARKPNIIQNSQKIINTSDSTKVDHHHQLDYHKEEWLKNLEDLYVRECSSLEVIFDNGEGPLAPALNKLKSLSLVYLEKLMHIWKNIPQQWLKNLEVLYVRECSSLEVIFDYGDGPLAPALDKLKSLSLVHLEKLMHIWKKGPQQVKTVGFQNLNTLLLHSSPSMRYLFTASIAKLLVMLESLQVVKCKSIEVVVAKTEEEINNDNVESYVVSFPHLVSIELNNLDNLSCFCQQPYAFEFPSLETLHIRECPKLETFVTANKTLKIPKLKGVELNDKYMEILEQDLNGTI